MIHIIKAVHMAICVRLHSALGYNSPEKFEDAVSDLIDRSDLPPVVRPPLKLLHADQLIGAKKLIVIGVM